jgi:NTP pyrophosphatase (non-canonical NTP hydrolase)
MRFLEFQDEVGAWARKNFDKSELGINALLGVFEEVGELSHAHLKQIQGIRGTPEEHTEKAKDAVGDILVYLADYCSQRGWNMSEIAQDTLKLVTKRDWKANSLNGKP